MTEGNPTHRPIKEDHSYFRNEIEKSRRRLADMEERGVDAMSRYDVEIAYGGNGQMALDQAKVLVGNHINYYGARLEELGPEVRQLDMFGNEVILKRAIEHDFYDPELDAHLEDDYDLRQGEGDDFNEIDQGMYDDDPSPYGGTYSEE